MQCSVPVDRGGAPSSAEADDSGGSALSKEEHVSCAHFCTMSLNSFSALVVALHANALVSFAQPATYGAPSAIFALPIPSPSTWSNEFSCSRAQVKKRIKAAATARTVRANKRRKEVAKMNAGRASKRQETERLIKDHKDLISLAQGVQAGMPKGNGVPLTHVRCMMVGRRVAGTIAHAAVPVSCIHGVFFGTGCPQVLVSTIPIAITSVSPYFCVQLNPRLILGARAQTGTHITGFPHVPTY